MTESLFSPSWYRVSKLKPRIRGHTQIHRHHYRDERWYVIQDHATGQAYRFTPIAYYIIGLMDARLTVQELWEKASERFGDDGPTQGDVVQLLSQLHAANLLICDVTPDTEEMFRRFKKVEGSVWKMNIRSPMSMRFPLLNPERFLAATIRYVRPLISIFGLILWLVVVGTAVTVAAMHWPELTRNVSDRILTAQSLLSIWFIFPIVKALHEFGHAYAVKAWGGEVHEMGIMFLVLLPIPYVDASSASAFRKKWRRLVVDAFGMGVEVFLAALALLLWADLAPGYLRSILYNVIFIAGISTVFFNANPLLRYDGYYIFSDIIEVSNLMQRSMDYMKYLAKRYLFGIKNLVTPYCMSGERFWFVVYSVATIFYRVFLYAAIILFIAGKFFTVGLLLAAWALVAMVGIPAFKGLKFIASSPLLRETRRRAAVISGLVGLALVVIIFVVPFPFSTISQGVIWVPENALVRAGTNGFVSKVIASPGQQVHRGSPLLECSDPLLLAQVKILEARLSELKARYDEESAKDQVQVRIVQDEMTHIKANLARARERVKNLVIRSRATGRFILPDAQNLPGRYLKRGELVGYVINAEKPTVRVVVSQSSIDLVRLHTRSIQVRLAERVGKILPAVMKREVPGAGHRLPSIVLGSGGGGDIPIDPKDKTGLKATDRFFQFDIQLTKPVERPLVHDRVYVRFNHGFEPMAYRWYRGLRRLFLRRFGV